KQPHHVIVHNVREEHQEEHQAHLNEAFLEAQAEIAAADAFHGEKQDVSAIQDGNRQQIEDAKVQTQNRHQRDDGKSSLLHRLARFVGYADDALELLGCHFAGNQLPDDVNDLP